MTIRHARIWFGACLVFVFVAGIAGGLMVRELIGSAASTDSRQRRRAAPAAADTAARIADEIGLNETQRERVDAILDSRQQMDDFFLEERSFRFRREHEQITDEINRMLTPEQRKTFAVLILRLQDLSHLTRPPARLRVPPPPNRLPRGTPDPTR